MRNLVLILVFGLIFLSKAVGAQQASIKVCDICPEMMVIPGGTFMMGSSEGRENEKPVHEVTISKPFAIAKYELTYADYNALASLEQTDLTEVDLERRNVLHFGKVYASETPVVLTFLQAQWYAETLSRMTGQRFRLPTEAEWEYSARAGTTSEFAFGHCIDRQQAAFSGKTPYRSCDLGEGKKFKTLNNRYISPWRVTRVGTYSPNAFGLYDMHGNVLEWTQDVYDVYPEDAQTDPQGPRVGSHSAESGDEIQEGAPRVVRGGNYYQDAFSLRSAWRTNKYKRKDLYDTGLRIVLELNSETANAPALQLLPTAAEKEKKERATEKAEILAVQSSCESNRDSRTYYDCSCKTKKFTEIRRKDKESSTDEIWQSLSFKCPNTTEVGILEKKKCIKGPVFPPRPNKIEYCTCVGDKFQSLYTSARPAPDSRAYITVLSKALTFCGEAVPAGPKKKLSNVIPGAEAPEKTNIKSDAQINNDVKKVEKEVNKLLGKIGGLFKRKPKEKKEEKEEKEEN